MPIILKCRNSTPILPLKHGTCCLYTHHSRIAPTQGFEPKFSDPEPEVMPLYDVGKRKGADYLVADPSSIRLGRVNYRSNTLVLRVFSCFSFTCSVVNEVNALVLGNFCWLGTLIDETCVFGCLVCSWISHVSS